MIEVEHIVSVRKPEKPDVVMSRMDYVIICQVIGRLNEIGMEDDELSFLLGKPNNYVFGFIVKPNDKNRFNEDQIDLLPYLLDCPFSRIIVNGTPSGNIHLHHTKKIDEEGYKGFSHIIYDENGKGTRVIWKKKQAPKGTTRKTNGVLLDLLKQWIIEGYFEQNQNALKIYKKLNAENVDFRISELEKCLKILCGTGQKLLEKDSVDGLLMYWNPLRQTVPTNPLSRLELQTERLSLRPFRKEDGAAMYELNDDPEVLQYTGDTQFADVAGAESFLENYSQYEEYGVGRMIVILKATGEILGWCGLKYHPEEDEYDIGYRFYKRHWGKGYATESAIAVMEDGIARLGMKQIVGRARVENTASIRVFDKLKMEFVEDFVEDGENWVLYQIVY